MWHVIKTIALLLLSSTTLAVFLPSNVRAADVPVKVTLNSVGATTWNIINVKPGDSGAKTVALQNAGYSDGKLTIWISSILDKEGINPESESGNSTEPGELGSCLVFKLSALGLRSDIVFPVNIYDFPQSTSDDRYIQIDVLRANTGVDLNWEWILPDDIGNEVQGDALSFSVNYMLEELASVPGGAGGGGSTAATTTSSTAKSVEIVSRDSGDRIAVQSNGVVTESRTITLVENRLIISLDQGTQILVGSAQVDAGTGTQILTDRGQVPSKIEVMVIEQPPRPPAGAVLIGQAYDMFAVGEFGRESIYFSSPLKLVLNYDSGLLPGNILSVYLAYYDETKQEWIRLDPPRGFIAGAGQAAAEVNHFTLFAVLAELVPAPSLPVPRPPAPARFQVRNLDVSPRKILIGDTVTLKSVMVNLGEQVGDYVLAVRVPGLLETTRTIRLEPGESQELSFQVTPTRPGVYQVRIGDLRGGFVVEELPTPTPIYTPTPAPAYPMEEVPDIYSWLTLAILAILALSGTTALVLAHRRRHSRS